MNFLFLFLTGFTGATAQSWQPLNHQAPVNVSTPLLLTDGTVMFHEYDTPNWWKLSPDITGGYLNGIWTQLASLPYGYAPRWYASAVLRDGKVLIEGGEDNFGKPIWTNLGALYDPKTNSWISIRPPIGWTTIGDAASVVLADGTFMLANCCTNQQALFNEVTFTWTITGTGKFDENDEEGWTLLPDNSVLTVDAYNAYDFRNGADSGGLTNSELYDPESGIWKSAGSTVVQLWDPPTNEVGPAILLPNGTIFATGANTSGAGRTSIYDPKLHRWNPGPAFPDGLDIADGPAVLLPSGNVLLMASPGYATPPATFFEWNGTSFNHVSAPPNASKDSSLQGNMLLLPTGEVILTDTTGDVELYHSNENPDPSWAPSASFTSSITVHRGSTFVMNGTLFNGMSQAVAFGDDYQAATNYPLVRITNNATGHVFYCKTHDHSTMAVGYSGAVSTHVDVPSTTETGRSTLEVIANGIASPPYDVLVQ